MPFGEGPRSSEPRSRVEDDTLAGTLPSPESNPQSNGRTFEHSTDLTCIASLNGGVLNSNGLELMTCQSIVRYLDH
ncbi:hypothetical protein TNCV_481101 [Trichonephila clavipes]|nr:hypothetical protein TNCV_481101 [Trichonephila clavipes]